MLNSSLRGFALISFPFHCQVFGLCLLPLRYKVTVWLRPFAQGVYVCGNHNVISISIFLIMHACLTVINMANFFMRLTCAMQTHIQEYACVYIHTSISMHRGDSKDPFAFVRLNCARSLFHVYVYAVMS